MQDPEQYLHAHRRVVSCYQAAAASMDPPACRIEVPFPIILDYDGEGNLVSLEVLDASKRVTEARKVEFQLAE